MTQKELSQLYHLNREIKMDERRIKELRAKAQSTSSGQLSGMPRNPTVESKLERYVAELVDLSVIISTKRQRCIHERNRLERYINDIEDSQTRQVFTLRFVDGMSWLQVAREIGGGATESYVCNVCHLYLKKQNKNKK